MDTQRPDLDSAGLKRSPRPEMASSLCQSLCQRMTKAWKEMKNFLVPSNFDHCECARPGPAALKWGFPCVPNHSWPLPGRPSGSLAPQQHVMADPKTLTRHPGKTSWQPSDINLAPWQDIPADQQTLTWHPAKHPGIQPNISPAPRHFPPAPA